LGFYVDLCKDHMIQFLWPNKEIESGEEDRDIVAAWKLTSNFNPPLQNANATNKTTTFYWG